VLKLAAETIEKLTRERNQLAEAVKVLARECAIERARNHWQYTWGQEEDGTVPKKHIDRHTALIVAHLDAKSATSANATAAAAIQEAKHGLP
jgi:hypothetical protein